MSNGIPIYTSASQTLRKHAFDSVHQVTLWKIMRYYGIPEKLIHLVKYRYSDNECAVVTPNGTSEWFKIKSGVKQGFNMSGFLFLLVIDWVVRKSTAENNTGIRWNFTTKFKLNNSKHSSVQQHFRLAIETQYTYFPVACFYTTKHMFLKLFNHV